MHMLVSNLAAADYGDTKHDSEVRRQRSEISANPRHPRLEVISNWLKKEAIAASMFTRGFHPRR